MGGGGGRLREAASGVIMGRTKDVIHMPGN